MKKIARLSVILFALTGFASIASTATPGAYLGAGLGYGYIEGSSTHTLTKNTTLNDSFIAGRIFGGYNFNRNFGLEAGYSYLGREEWTIKSNPNTYTTTVTNHFQDLDLVAKAYLPIHDSGLNLYALGGVAYVVNTGRAIVQNAQTTSVGPFTSTNAVLPKYGVGLSYDIPNTQLTTNLELSRVQGNGTSFNFPSADNALLTISYNFG